MKNISRRSFLKTGAVAAAGLTTVSYTHLSDSIWNTVIEFSIAVSVATRWIDWITIFFASLLAVIFASSTISLM